MQKVCHSTHEFGNAGRFLAEFVVSREGEHTLGQGCTPLRTLHCIFEQGYALGVIGQALAQQFKTAKDRGQQVVKIMGDAACELADRLQFLRLQRKFTGPFEPPLGFFALSQVPSNLCKTNDLADGGADRINDDVGPKTRSVLPDTPAFSFEFSLASSGLQRPEREAIFLVFISVKA